MEYDLQRSSVTGGVLLRKAVKIEQSAVPTACMWLGRMKESSEPIVVTANSQARTRRPHATRPHSSH